VGQEDGMSEKKIGPCGVISIVLAVLNCLGLVVFTVGMLFQRPEFIEIYAGLGTALPVGTRMIIAIPSVVVLLIAGLFLALLIAKEFIPKKIVPLVLNLVWIVIAVVASVLVSLALMAPLVGTMEQM
jgi:hypothetical protein